MKKSDLLKKKNVVLVYTGKKVVGGVETDRDSIRVGVVQKVPLAQLAEKDVVPQTIEGIETDVFQTEEIKALAVDRTSKIRPAPGGVSIGHCLFPFARILTNYGLKPIKDIHEGDLVLTHENKFQKVIGIHKRFHVGDYISLRYSTSKGVEGITATSEHPILSYRNGSLEWKAAKDFEVGDYIFILANQCSICGEDIPWFYKYCDAHHHMQKNSKPRLANQHHLRSGLGTKHYTEDILPAAKDLQKQGFRVVPIGKIVPDVVAIKDDKIYAVEVEDLTSSHSLIPNYQKYPNELSSYINDVIWVIKTKQNKTTHKVGYISNLLPGFVAIKIIEKLTKTIPAIRTRNRRSCYSVFDLEVEDSHSFIASRAIVHNSSVTAGTLGMFVKKAGARYILSNNHVLANSNNASMGDQTWQPGKYDGGSSADTIGHLSDFIPINFTDESNCPIATRIVSAFNFLAKLFKRNTRLPNAISSPINKVDCAIARPLIDEDISQEILEVGKPVGFGEAKAGDKVKKSGRTSGLTQGDVIATDGATNVNYGGKVAIFEDQIITSAMSEGGDSGSAVLNEKNEVVGLLFAGSSSLTIANKIANVIDALGLDKGD